MLLLRTASNIGKRQNDDREARRGGFCKCGGARGLRVGGLADIKRIDANWLSDVLELSRAEIGDLESEPTLDLTISVLGETNRAWLANSFHSRGDIDAVAHQIAIGLLDHVAEMNANSKLDAALRRQAGVALGHAILHLDSATHRVDHAAKFDEAAVACAFYDASVMRVDGGINQIAPQSSEPRQRAILVCPREPAIADNIRD
jgi:hypothetical protein